MIFSSPLSLQVSTRRKFILNLNQYRNTHFRVLNNAKKLYKEAMKEQILSINKTISRCRITYTVYKGDKRGFDIGNICAVHQKFFEDALVELGKLEDDKYTYIPETMFKVGGIDIENPRVEIEIKELR